MGRKLQTIYEYLDEYLPEDIDKVIENLSEEEKSLIVKRYGKDLNNPVTDNNWNFEDNRKFYNLLIPKIKRMLKSRSELSNKENTNNNYFENTEFVQTGYTSFLIQLLNDGKNDNEICKFLKITPQQLYQELLKLKNLGFTYSKKYYSDGTIKYNNIKTLHDLKKYKNNRLIQNETIITDKKESSVKVLAIADLHFGNDLERIDLLDRAFNYCVKNGIHIILCGGDIIDGTFTKGKQKITDVYKQIEHFLKNYPYDKSILTFSVAGDHDYSAFYKSSIDVMEICKNYRHDIIIGGYNNAVVNIKNDKIHLYHLIGSGKIFQIDAPIVLHGHKHQYLTFMKDNQLNISIPTLSGLTQMEPSTLELTINFNKNGFISNTIIKHLYFSHDKDIIISEVAYDLAKKQYSNDDFIKNVEEYRLDLEQNDQKLVLERSKKTLSQVDKFYKRYGK